MRSAAANMDLVVHLHNSSLQRNNIANILDRRYLNVLTGHRSAACRLLDVEQRLLTDDNHFLSERENSFFKPDVQFVSLIWLDFVSRILNRRVANERYFDGV